MAGSIEQLRRWIRLPVASMFVAALVVGPAKDPVRRVTGYGGVLLVPARARANAANRDLSLDGRRDVRAARGRVLYSPGHVPAAADTHVVRPAHRVPCPQRSVAQARSDAAMPNS